MKNDVINSYEDELFLYFQEMMAVIKEDRNVVFNEEQKKEDNYYVYKSGKRWYYSHNNHESYFIDLDSLCKDIFEQFEFEKKNFCFYAINAFYKRHGKKPLDDYLTKKDLKLMKELLEIRTIENIKDGINYDPSYIAKRPSDARSFSRSDVNKPNVSLLTETKNVVAAALCVGGTKTKRR